MASTVSCIEVVPGVCVVHSIEIVGGGMGGILESTDSPISASSDDSPITTPSGPESFANAEETNLSVMDVGGALNSWR